MWDSVKSEQLWLVNEQVEIRPGNNKLNEYSLSKINITEQEEAKKSKVGDTVWILRKKDADLEINPKYTAK